MHAQSHNTEIILASSSPYRKSLLERLQLEFRVVSPEVDESPGENESPKEMVERLAREKARVVSDQNPRCFVLGSDQVAIFGTEIIGKPGTVEHAACQLRRFSGQDVLFLTAICVCCKESGFIESAVVVSEARFRNLSDGEIDRYLALDMPLDCAGSFKSEAAGISLLASLRSDDPTAIIGLPLITVSALLREAGFNIP